MFDEKKVIALLNKPVILRIRVVITTRLFLSFVDFTGMGKIRKMLEYYIRFYFYYLIIK